MKKYVLVVAVAAALFSCSGNPKADATQYIETYVSINMLT